MRDGMRGLKIGRVWWGLGGALGVSAGVLAACQSLPPAEPGQAVELTDEAAARCEALVGRTIGGALVDRVDVVARGQKGGRELFGSTKAPVPFCRVHAAGSSGPGSQIRIQVLLPGDWNGKLVGVGGGGLSGGLSASTGGLMPELARGYAGVANDAGHTDEKNAAWAIGAPARVEDFGFRANHVAAVAGKAIAETFYAQPVVRSYFSGCSNGGRDAMMLAQRHPQDYDGIIAGAPAINWTGVMVAAQAYPQAMRSTPGAERLPSKLAMVREAVIRKCDRLDGVADNVLENPLACDFDPAELLCQPGQGASRCLTEGDVAVIRAIYRGLHTHDGTRIISGFPVSSEHGRAVLPLVGWAAWFLDGLKAGTRLSTEYFRGVVTGNLEWNPENFDLERDYALARARTGRELDALDTDLRPFIGRGGKLLMFHGWEDPALPAGDTVAYYEAVRSRLGDGADSKVRLFMAPGMAHCSLGHGPDRVDLLPVLDAWVSRGEAPTSVLATKRELGVLELLGRTGKTLRTRPLCPWPQTAHYRGSGSTDDADNFVCRAAGSASATGVGASAANQSGGR